MTKAVLIDRKGDTFARSLIEHCLAMNALPKTIVDFLKQVHETMKLPSLEDETEIATVSLTAKPQGDAGAALEGGTPDEV